MAVHSNNKDHGKVKRSGLTGSRQGGQRSVLVTGGAGFIGANLVRMLLERGYSVTVLDSLIAQGAEYLEGLPVGLIRGDILDHAAVKEAVVGQDAVVHLAAQTGVPGSLRDPRKDCEVNIFGTLNMLEACRSEGDRKRSGRTETENQGSPNAPIGPRFVFASSNAPLGRQSPPATEEMAPLPISPYGASKLAGEAYCLAYNGSWGLPTLALRFGNVYGPFSAHKDSVIAKFFKDLAARKPLMIDGDGEQTRDFIYVGDLCVAILCALESPVSGEVFQIATGVETSIHTVSVLIAEITGDCAHIEHGPARLGDIRRNYSVIAKANELLGWQPTTSLREGLDLTWKWFLSQPMPTTAKADLPIPAR